MAPGSWAYMYFKKLVDTVPRYSSKSALMRARTSFNRVILSTRVIT